MRDHLRPGHLLRSHPDHPRGHGLPAPENFSWYRGGGDFSVCIMDVGYISYVGNIGDITDVGDIHLAQVSGSVVVPREERLPRPQGEPSVNAPAANSHSHGEPSTADERD
jgi:hypothetical protein